MKYADLKLIKKCMDYDILAFVRGSLSCDIFVDHVMCHTLMSTTVGALVSHTCMFFLLCSEYPGTSIMDLVKT